MHAGTAAAVRGGITEIERAPITTLKFSVSITAGMAQPKQAEGVGMYPGATLGTMIYQQATMLSATKEQRYAPLPTIVGLAGR
ncbi:MAG TPA: hypothetical protein VK638_22505 [Edaphobacter sp.]|nr:hypothetical protein [Edaphobacter sp.]